MAITRLTEPVNHIRNRAIINRDYIAQLDGRAHIQHPETTRFLENNRMAPTMNDPFGATINLADAYENAFGMQDRIEWQNRQRERDMANGEERAVRDRQIVEMIMNAGATMEYTETLQELTGIREHNNGPTFGEMEQDARRNGMFNQTIGRRIPDGNDQIDAMTRMDDMLKPPEPTLLDLLMRELPRETTDIIGEVGEEYELNVTQSLGFIIDMYRQFTKRGDNKVLSNINLELSKLKEESNGHKSDAEGHQQGDEATGEGQERFPPF